MEKFIIVLGGSTDQVFLIKKIHDFGLKTICVDKNKGCIGAKLSDIFINIDFKKYQKVIKNLKKFQGKIFGIVLMGSDKPVIASKIAKYFNLTFINEKTASICENKIKMKKLFTKLAIPTADYIYSKSKSRIYKFKKKYNKIIIKPPNCAGSRGVYLISNFKELYSCYPKTQKYLKKGEKVILEEYLTGQQISTESIINNYKVYTYGYADRNYIDTKKFYPQILENGGTVPSKNCLYFSKVEKILKKIVKEIKFKNGVIKGDFVIHKKRVKIIEFAGRLSGGDFCESLVPLSTNKEYVSDLINISMGKKVKNRLNEFKYIFNVKNRYFFLPPGKLKSIKNITKFKNYNSIKKLEIFYKKGDILKKVSSHGTRAGVFVVKSKSETECDKVIDQVYSQVKFQINNKWITGDPKVKKYD